MRNGVKVCECDTHLHPTVETISLSLDPGLPEQAPQWGENVIGEFGLVSSIRLAPRPTGHLFTHPSLTLRAPSRTGTEIDDGKIEVVAHLRR